MQHSWNIPICQTDFFSVNCWVTEFYWIFQEAVKENAKQAHEYFNLLWKWVYLLYSQGTVRYMYTVDSIHRINYKFQIYSICVLFHRLLNYASAAEVKLPNAEKQLNNEIQWIKKTKVLGTILEIHFFSFHLQSFNPVSFWHNEIYM